MKNSKLILFGFVLAIAAMILLQCQHDDSVIPIEGPNPDDIVRGTETLSCTNCTPLQENGASSDFNSGGVPSGQWYFDKAHSNVGWETAYVGVGSLLTGRFNYFVLKDLNFDEQDASQISFEGYVRLNSVNTGEPGRDGGCLLGTYGTDAAKTSEPENIATIKSTSVQLSTTDAGYIATADFTFHGVTQPVTVKLNYAKQTHIASSAPYTLAGLEGQFEFNVLTDFDIVSTNIADKVVVKMNVQLKKKD